jgi:uncharacterized protein (DUF58 family)
MLSLEDRRRIEAEEQYRAEVRARLGPVQTTSFINKLAKLIVVIVVGWFVLALAIGVWALLLSATLAASSPTARAIRRSTEQTGEPLCERRRTAPAPCTMRLRAAASTRIQQ